MEQKLGPGAAASVESGKTTGSAMKSAGQDGGTEDLFKLNQVFYQLPPSLSLVSKRCITRCQFQQTSYSQPANGAPATCIFNTGEFQVNGCTSFLVIQCGIDVSTNAVTNTDAKRNATHCLLAQGGIMNLFEEVIFTTASGTEVDRQQNKGLLQSHVNRNTLTQQYYDTAGESLGTPGGAFRDCYNKLGWPGTQAINAWLQPIRNICYQDLSVVVLGAGAALNTSFELMPGTNTGSVDLCYNSAAVAGGVMGNTGVSQAPIFIIPLSQLLGCFSPYTKALIPSQLLAGGRLDIRWKNFSEALTATGPALTTLALAQSFVNSLTITNIYFDLDCYQMNDSVLKRLNEISAGSGGLEMTFDTWDWAQTAVSILNFEAQVTQARSRVIRSFCVIRDTMEIQNPFANSLASEATVKRQTGNVKLYLQSNNNNNEAQQLVANYQAKLGNLYFPQQPLTTVEECCMNQYYMFSKNYCNPDDTSPINLDEFMGANGSSHTDGAGTINPPVGEGAGTTSQAARVYSAGYPEWTQNWGSGVFGFSAERSQLLQLTGLPLSNSRLLRHTFNLNYQPAGARGRQIDVFTQFTKMAKIFLGGRVVMRE